MPTAERIAIGAMSLGIVGEVPERGRDARRFRGPPRPDLRVDPRDRADARPSARGAPGRASRPPRTPVGLSAATPTGAARCVPARWATLIPHGGGGRSTALGLGPAARVNVSGRVAAPGGGLRAINDVIRRLGVTRPTSPSRATPTAPDRFRATTRTSGQGADRCAPAQPRLLDIRRSPCSPCGGPREPVLRGLRDRASTTTVRRAWCASRRCPAAKTGRPPGAGKSRREDRRQALDALADLQRQLALAVVVVPDQLEGTGRRQLQSSCRW